MSTLAALQQDFLSTLTGAPLLIHALDAARGLAPKRGLAIYVNAYSARLREALHNDHASLAMLMGEQAWHALVAGYIAAHPSRGPSLRQFGDGLPDFLRRDARYAATPLLAELADFERALLDSFDAADAPVADWADLLALPPARWPRLRPGFVPSLARRVTRTAAVETWKASPRCV